MVALQCDLEASFTIVDTDVVWRACAPVTIVTLVHSGLITETRFEHGKFGSCHYD